MTWVSFLAAVLLCLLAGGAPAASEERASCAQLAVAGTADLTQHSALPVPGLQATALLAEPTLPPQQWLPLVLKHYYRLPPWSGTARFGFGVVKNPVEEYDISLLGPDWYVDFGFRADPPPLFKVEYAQTVRLSESGYAPNQATIEKYARAQPGALWLIGNEPDAPAQDCVTPQTYAQLYHDLYGIIKGADPTAKVAIGGVVQATPLRLQYLDMILDEYETLYDGIKIPVDVWNVHGFILQEKKNDWGCQIPCGITGVTQGMLYTIDDHDNMTIFTEQIRRFRIWMNERGERNKPLIVSEYGILMPEELGFNEPRVEAFMLATFDYFRTATSAVGFPEDGNRLVQAWCWYSLDDDYFEGYHSYSHLFNPDTKQLTALGRAYRNYTSSLP